MAKTYGAAGRMAAAFIHSKLTPLFIVASIALGALAVVALPREEEPQIIVPMVDVFVEMPGRHRRRSSSGSRGRWSSCCGRCPASNTSTRRRVPASRWSSSASGSTSRRKPRSSASIRNWPRMPTASRRASSGPSSSRARSTTCRCSPSRSGRRATRTISCVARRPVADAIAEVADVSEVTIIGGRPRQVRVDIDPARLSAYDLDPLSVQQAIARTNVRGTASGPVAGGVTTGLEAGRPAYRR